MNARPGPDVPIRQRKNAAVVTPVRCVVRTTISEATSSPRGIPSSGTRRGPRRSRAVQNRMRVRVVVLAAGLLLWLAGSARALDSHRRATQYAQTHYESRDGMPHGLANSIAQTGDGYLWTGSEEGLARFDGASFTTFDHRKTDGIPANMFTALAID